MTSEGEVFDRATKPSVSFLDNADKAGNVTIIGKVPKACLHLIELEAIDTKPSECDDNRVRRRVGYIHFCAEVSQADVMRRECPRKPTHYLRTLTHKVVGGSSEKPVVGIQGAKG